MAMLSQSVRSRRYVASLWLATLLVACTGEISPAEQRRFDDTENGARGEAGDAGDGASNGTGVDGDPTNVEGEGATSGEGTPGTPEDPSFRFATLGERCSGGARKQFLVVSRTELTCADHAKTLDDAAASDVLRIPLDASKAFNGSVSLCSAGACSEVVTKVALTDAQHASLDAALSGSPIKRNLTLTACDYDAAAPPSRDALAANITLREVALYQGVKVPLATGGAEVAQRKAPVVLGRPALVRAFVDPGAGFVARTLVARLELVNGTEPPIVIESQLAVSAASSDAALKSTFNFDVPATALRADTTYSVGVHELEVCGGAAASGATGRFPATGKANLAARASGGTFRVTLVPVRYNADLSGRVPATDAATVEKLRQQLFAMFPVENVEITVRAPMDFGVSIEANGDGWGELLDACLAARAQDKPSAEVYYYCMFDPRASFRDYCNGGCVAGLGTVPGANDVGRRGGIGLGFGDGGDTMVHELGHTLGRPHAPCGGPDGPDPRYPYAGGVIGSWGYDLRSKSLVDPQKNTDIMGYCGSQWISDYNYNLVFDRFRSVLSAPLRVGPQAAFSSVVVRVDGSLKFGHHQSLDFMPDGVPVAVRAYDASGSEVLHAQGSFAALTHITGGIVYMPQLPTAAVRVEIEGYGSLDL